MKIKRLIFAGLLVSMAISIYANLAKVTLQNNTDGRINAIFQSSQNPNETDLLTRPHDKTVLDWSRAVKKDCNPDEWVDCYLQFVVNVDANGQRGQAYPYEVSFSPRGTWLTPSLSQAVINGQTYFVHAAYENDKSVIHITVDAEHPHRGHP